MAITGELPRGRRRLEVSAPAQPARRRPADTSPPPPWTVDQPAPRPEERAAQQALKDARRLANQLAAEEALRLSRLPAPHPAPSEPIGDPADDEDWFAPAPRRRLSARTARRVAAVGVLLLVVGGGTALAESQAGAAAVGSGGSDAVGDHASRVLDPFQRAAEAGPVEARPAGDGPLLLGRTTP